MTSRPEWLTLRRRCAVDVAHPLSRSRCTVRLPLLLTPANNCHRRGRRAKPARAVGVDHGVEGRHASASCSQVLNEFILLSGLALRLRETQSCIIPCQQLHQRCKIKRIPVYTGYIIDSDFMCTPCLTNDPLYESP